MAAFGEGTEADLVDAPVFMIIRLLDGDVDFTGVARYHDVFRNFA